MTVDLTKERGLARKPRFTAEARNELMAFDGDAEAVLHAVAKVGAGYRRGTLILSMPLGPLTGEVIDFPIAGARVRYVLTPRMVLVLQVVAKGCKDPLARGQLGQELVRRHARVHQAGTEALEDVRRMVQSRAERDGPEAKRASQ